MRSGYDSEDIRCPISITFSTLRRGRLPSSRSQLFQSVFLRKICWHMTFVNSGTVTFASPLRVWVRSISDRVPTFPGVRQLAMSRDWLRANQWPTVHTQNHVNFTKSDCCRHRLNQETSRTGGFDQVVAPSKVYPEDGGRRQRSRGSRSRGNRGQCHRIRHLDAICKIW